ncbi:23S rRNA (guanosine2251-2'-O)-methyltransferase [Seinonella peptonophila]|uniref:23S rRNA (Guanosine2251-2'-O)-methyltransferase n=1 Tax=Seinonella peptonophila TaxID=112248 RepID=A0A1M4YU96_9BACL|nr:23S rRNA (guanosine(2251)-2'-O)-methyltransferase RlmB [Seinonella peptonophila]SHF09331.1 23S rRNA (guanosine2251-2'-O)-methyltransferase [Seinonella peptonophila]
MDQEWIYGRQAVLEALRSESEIEKVLFAEGIQKNGIKSLLDQLHERGIPYQWVPRSRMDQLASGGRHQGVMARQAAFRYASLEECFKRASDRGAPPFFLLLDGIEDPHNLGSIIRTADASGVHGVILPKRRAVGLTPIVAKTSAGAVAHVPVVRVANLSQTAKQLQSQGVWLVGSDGEASQSYLDVDYKAPIALVIGNEGKGIRQQMKKRCDFLVRLPMLGQVSSLNASVAAGIFMYEVVRHRGLA